MDGRLVQFSELARSIDDPPLRSGICLGIGSVALEQIRHEELRAWEPLLTSWFMHKRDSGTHSAAGLALRQWNLGTPTIAPTREPADGYEWHVNSVGMTMLGIPATSSTQLDAVSSKLGAVLRDPNDARLIYVPKPGSTLDDPHYIAYSPVTHPFLLSDREVTVRQFRQFVDDPEYSSEEKPVDRDTENSLEQMRLETEPSLLDYPATQVNWFDALLFCNWLSRKEGLQPVYERTGAIERFSSVWGEWEGERWRVIPGANGYRLPTRAEWIHACRALTTTDFSHGDDISLLSKYAVFRADEVGMCGAKLPNAWGLFDIHGNVEEWCYDYATSNGSHVIQGGGYNSRAKNCQATSYSSRESNTRLAGSGFRVAAGSAPPRDVYEKLRRITVPDDVESLHVALERAAKGATITIKPGLYRYDQPLLITDDLTLVGTTPNPSDTTLECTGRNALVIEGGDARLRHLSLRFKRDKPRESPKDQELFEEIIKGDRTDPFPLPGRHAAAWIRAGSPEIEDCDLTSDAGWGLVVEGVNSNPTVMRCVLHSAGASGVCVLRGAKAMFLDCDFDGNQGQGVDVRETGDPTFKNCKIRGGKYAGIVVRAQGKGVFEDCDVFGNAMGVLVAGLGDPSFKNCRIHDGGAGIGIQREGKGTFETCDIFGTSACGIFVEGVGNPLFKNCKIRDGGPGILFRKGCKGTLEHCDISGNDQVGVCVSEEADPTFKACKIHDGRQRGVFVSSCGKGTFDDCDIYGNAEVGIEIDMSGDPTIRDCRVERNGRGVHVHNNGKGTFLNVTLRENTNGQWVIEEDAGPVRRFEEYTDE
ncbi:MAG: right-handed parallel beta-helix repeat-containing protein [Planctomycetes bacterium]|nr:right-handed parallel beta-helix repeat-containing protein [Planctomycetota bacterium]MBL7044651.1 right-handed parallel beta-helix repeat-containing protein [Pirellulaceae bacterium]